MSIRRIADGMEKSAPHEEPSPLVMTIGFKLVEADGASVPDGGTTLVLLGSALTGLAALRRKLLP